MKSSKTKMMVESAVMICISVLLSMITVFKMPLGGSVTLLSMLPVCIISIKYGTKQGLLTAFVYSLAQLAMSLGEIMSWGLTPATLAGSFIFDYILAYSVLGLAGLFGNKDEKSIYSGIVLAMLLRFVSHFISGTVFFKALCPEGWNFILYSVCYNGAYMLPETIFTVIGTVIIFRTPQLSKLISAK